jgi:3-dehydroquinate synthetase
MKNDKKNKNNGIIFTLLSKIGKAHFNQEVDVETILEAMNYYNSIIREKVG